MRVLVVDDHENVAEVVERPLAQDGHRIARVQSIADADAHLAEAHVDAIVLDLVLLDGSGLDWCRRIRAEGLRGAILMLGALSSVSTRVAALDAGADDFLARPFAVVELRARIRALGRRGQPESRLEATRGTVHLDFAA